MNEDFRKNFENPETFLRNILTKGEVIAELGCGTGFYCQFLKEFAAKLYCVDAFCPALEEAKKKAPSAIFLCEDASKTSIPSESVDVVLFANSFHDMKNKDLVVKEVKRILKKGGRVIIIDWDKRNTRIGPPSWIRMSEEEYIEYFKDFKLIDKFKPSEYQYGLVFIKND
ncbi:class I SAM-dependent methyltransferase [Sulfurisphaera javensis]